MMEHFIDIPPLILLAAGKSERMGSPKGLIKLNNGNTLLSMQLKTFTETIGQKIIIVLGAHLKAYKTNFPWIENAMTDWTTADNASIRVAYNENFEKGQFTSLQKGLEIFQTLPDPFAFILPIDVPCPSEMVWKTLMRKTRLETQAAIPEFREKGGHPVLIAKNFANRLLKIDPDAPEARLDLQIKNLTGKQQIRVPVEEDSILTNLNDPNELRRYLNSANLKLTID